LRVKVAFFGGNLANLMKEINIAKPSLIIMVPRILNRIYDALKARFEALP